MPKRIYKIFCRSKKNVCYRKPNYLGYLLVDRPSAAGFHCKNCKTHYEYTITAAGVVFKKKLHPKLRLEEFDTLMVVEKQNGNNKKK